MPIPIENNVLQPPVEQTPSSISPQGSEDLTEEDKKIIALVDETFARYRKRRQGFERDWFRNCIFKLGNQWIRWDKDTQQFRKKKLASWVPTPVTNIFNSTGERLVSVLSRIEPNWVFVPASDTEEDIASAEMSELIEPIICEENEVEKLRARCSQWLTWTGNAFLYCGAEEVVDLKMQAMKTQMEKEMPGAGDIMDEMMQGGESPMGPQAPSEYKLYTDILSPFEVYTDMTIQEISQQEKILLVNPRDKEWVKRTYGEDVEEERGEGLSLRYLETLGYVSSEFGAFGDQGSASGIGSDNTIPRCLVKRFFQRPNEDYPDGLYAVVSGGKLLEKGILPKTLGGKPEIPIVHMKFDEVPGAFFGMSTMNDIIPKQVMLNQLDSLILLITTRMASPIWKIPSGTKVNSWNIGEPGSVLEYSMIGDKATPPDRIPGEQIPSTLIQWRQELKKDIEELSATFDALKGKSPYSGAPAELVNMLIEQGMSRFGPAFRNIADGWRHWMKFQIELFRQYATTARSLPNKTDNGEWKFKQFTNADIKGAVNVRIESDSYIPRSESAESAKMVTAATANLVDMTDQDNRMTLLRELHLEKFTPDISDDIHSAEMENDLFLMIPPEQPLVPGLPPPPPPQIPPVNEFIDNHQIHIKRHKRFANTDKGRPFIPYLNQHIAQHDMIMQAMMNPGIPTPGAPPAGKPEINPKQAETLSPQKTVPGTGGPQG